MPSERGTAWRVGLLVLVALAVLATGIFLIGEKSHLFSRKHSYYARFGTVSGLNPGNPVQLNGVDVGSVTDIVLPEDPGERLIRVDLSVDSRYAGRIREDSEARIKTLGLLGDKYIEITSGSPDAPVIAEGSEIPAEISTELDKLMASGEDVMANITEISSSLKTILARMERGEGLLGELSAEPESGRRVTEAMVETLDAVKEVADGVRRGDGTLARLIHDPSLADRLGGAVDRLDAVLVRFEEGEGLLPALLEDPSGRESFSAALASLETTSAELAELSRRLQAADGLAARLLFDEEYGRRITGQLEDAIERLNRVTAKLEGGDGTAARLLEDPAIYQALEDIVVGVNESRILRWLLRNRQKAGIRKRYEDAVEAGEVEPLPGEGR